jgi:hypothetical protein
MIPSSPDWGAPFPRDLIVLAFKEDASQRERQQAVDAVGGEVIGGEHIDRGGYYYVRRSLCHPARALLAHEVWPHLGLH